MKADKKTLLYLQPIFPAYRQHVIDSLNADYDLHLAGDVRDDGVDGFDFAKLPPVSVYRCPSIPLLGGRLFLQIGVFSALRRSKPEVVLTFANLRYLTYWMLLLYCKLLGIRVFSYGQGLYRKPRASWLLKHCYKIVVRMQSKYICYNEYSARSLIDAGINPRDVGFINNTILLAQPSFHQAADVADEFALLYVGRLRAGSNVDLLAAACAKARDEGVPVKLHVVGDGPMMDKLKDEFADCDWLKLHGRIFDESEIASIARGCKYGCYAGDAGLSIVHYFGLSLPPIVHGSLCNHMGPEPAYVRDGENGFFFERGDLRSLKDAIVRAHQMTGPRYARVREAAFMTYRDLTRTDYSTSFTRLLREEAK